MSRLRTYDAEAEAKKISETFKAKPIKKRVELPTDWPSRMQHVGENVRIDYDSDKWKKDGDFEQYAHVAESRNRCLVKPGFLAPFASPSKKFPVHGPIVDFCDAPMPKHVAMLARFLGVNILLNAPWTPGTAPASGEQHVHVQVKHGVLLGGEFQWSKVGLGKNEPFVAVYTEHDGIVMMMMGDRFSIEKDGLTG